MQPLRGLRPPMPQTSDRAGRWGILDRPHVVQRLSGLRSRTAMRECLFDRSAASPLAGKKRSLQNDSQKASESQPVCQWQK